MLSKKVVLSIRKSAHLQISETSAGNSFDSDLTTNSIFNHRLHVFSRLFILFLQIVIIIEMIGVNNRILQLQAHNHHQYRFHILKYQIVHHLILLQLQLMII